MTASIDHLGQILARKRVEVSRRARIWRASAAPQVDRRAAALAALRRAPGAPPAIIAEIKRRSPSAGEIRARARGDVEALARAYVAGGAAAVSVLADRPGFGGSVLDVRRAARAVAVPILFKEFVLDPVQLEAARAAGASLVLLLVCALDDERLRALVRETRARGMEPVVEAADERELDRALATEATIVGVNARDLKSFSIDGDRAARALSKVPNDRIAVYMSGVSTPGQLAEIERGRVDAVLVGTALMRASDPAASLRALLAGARPRERA